MKEKVYLSFSSRPGEFIRNVTIKFNYLFVPLSLI